MDGTMSRGERWRLVSVLLFGLTAGMGCMSLNIGPTYERPASTSFIDASGVLKQHNESPIIRSAEGPFSVIYYPRPYASKPNLKFIKNADSVNPNEVEIVEQLPDHFTVRWLGKGHDPVLAWEAEGMPAPTPESKAVTQAKGEQ